MTQVESITKKEVQILTDYALWEAYRHSDIEEFVKLLSDEQLHDLDNIAFDELLEERDLLNVISQEIALRYANRNRLILKEKGVKWSEVEFKYNCNNGDTHTFSILHSGREIGELMGFSSSPEFHIHLNRE